MANPIFNAMNGGNQGGGMNKFVQFMNQMKGQNPRAMINSMVQSGRISQQQLNDLQQQVQQISGSLDQFKGMFGFK